MALDRPHLRMPLQLGPNGKFIAVEESSAEHVNSQEAAVALCSLGFREARPDFGWRIPTMLGAPLDPQNLVDALDRLVPLPDPREASAYITLATDPSSWTVEIDSQVESAD